MLATLPVLALLNLTLKRTRPWQVKALHKHFTPFEPNIASRSIPTGKETNSVEFFSGIGTLKE